MAATNSWQVRRLRVPTDLEDAVGAALWAAGAYGFESVPLGSDWLSAAASDAEIQHVELRVWVEARKSQDATDTMPAIDTVLAAWRDRGVEELGREAVPERDWLAEHRARSQPMALGRRLRVDPRDPEEAAPSALADPPAGDPAADRPSAGRPSVGDPAERIDLLIPAQNAFGTGSHESTRLVVALLERIDLVGLDVLDAGVGSGILSLAALALGARSACGFDLDVPSVVTAHANAVRNLGRIDRALGEAGSLHLLAGRADSLASAPAFDLALVNVLPERVLDDYPRLVATLRPGGRLISSGNLLDRRDELVERFEAFGLTLLDEAHEGEWVAFLFRCTERSPVGGPRADG